MLSVLSRVLDDDQAAGRPPPRRVLDAGCGVGVIGICAAAMFPTAYVRCQDRDELARLVTLHNAAKNGVAPATLEAFTEPLLAGPAPWDLILSNIPAKAGTPVLEDFVRRSVRLLSPGGRVMIVAVHTLADFFREQIVAAGAELVLEKKGPGHSVFVYGATVASQETAFQATAGLPVEAGPGFLERYPFYARASAECRVEDIDVRIATIHGASGFDAPGGAVLAAAKLVSRIGLQKLAVCGNVLVHEPGQGFFPRWLLEFLRGEQPQTLVLSGRNILALEAARHNIPQAIVVPAVDLLTLPSLLVNESEAAPHYSLIAAFPELLSQKPLSRAAGIQAADQLATLWDSLPPLLADGGIFIAAFGSSDAERFDRKKLPGFSRLGSIKRGGFRALAYRYL